MSIGKVDDMEVDFITSNNDGIEYYQVAATVRDADTLDRELKPFKKITDHFPKYLLTLDDDPPTFHKGFVKSTHLIFC